MSKWSSLGFTAILYSTMFFSAAYIVTRKTNSVPVPYAATSSNMTYCGTAFFVGPRTLLTAKHVVKGATTAWVEIGVPNTLYITNTSSSSDVAVLSSSKASSSWLSLGRILDMETVSVIGYPRTDAYGRNLKQQSGMAYNTWSEIMLDIPAWPGNSGSPILNSHNEVVGVETKGTTFQDLKNGGYSSSAGVRDSVLLDLVPDLKARGSIAGSIVYICREG